MSITDVQTMGDFSGDADDGTDGVVALRTPLYLLVALTGLIMFIASFLPWAGVKALGEGDVVGGSRDGFVSSITGLDAGGWGLAAMIAGLAIAALGVLGYFWNPFSDPEAMFIAAFGALVSIAALIKMLDASSLFPDAGDFDAPNAVSRFGLWIVLIAGLDALISGLWILYSRPKAQVRLVS